MYILIKCSKKKSFFYFVNTDDFLALNNKIEKFINVVTPWQYVKYLFIREY